MHISLLWMNIPCALKPGLEISSCDSITRTKASNNALIDASCPAWNIGCKVSVEWTLKTVRHVISKISRGLTGVVLGVIMTWVFARLDSSWSRIKLHEFHNAIRLKNQANFFKEGPIAINFCKDIRSVNVSIEVVWNWILMYQESIKVSDRQFRSGLGVMDASERVCDALVGRSYTIHKVPRNDDVSTALRFNECAETLIYSRDVTPLAVAFLEVNKLIVKRGFLLDGNARVE